MIARLTSADATTDDVKNVRFHAANTRHCAAINEDHRTFFLDPAPTRVFVPVASRFGAFDREIGCVAYTG